MSGAMTPMELTTLESHEYLSGTGATCYECDGDIAVGETVYVEDHEHDEPGNEGTPARAVQCFRYIHRDCQVVPA